jgi:hypothetical protein
MDRDPSARLAKIFDPPIHHCDVTRYILLVQANESTILKKRKEEKVTKGVNPLLTARLCVQSSRKCEMPEPGLVMKAKQLAPSIQSEAVRAEVRAAARPAIHRPTNFLTRPER